MDSLVERRLFPRVEREAFEYEVVRFHLEDLNAIADRRRARVRRARTAAPDLARVRAIIQAARWNRPSFGKAIRRYAAEGRAGGEDGFGPALLLMALADGAAPGGRRADAEADRRVLAAVARPARVLATAVLAEADSAKPVVAARAHAGGKIRRAPRGAPAREGGPR